MTDENQTCPKCNSKYGYNDGSLWVCPECFHEWALTKVGDQQIGEAEGGFFDVNGVKLQDGDTITTVKDLKVGKDTLKAGTKVKNIKLLDELVNGHDISCKIPGHGSMYLKCSVVKKVK